MHTKVKVCRADENKLASEVDVARGEYNEKEYYVLKNESSAWQDDIWAWIDGQSDPKYKVPREYCTTDTATVIGFEKPRNNEIVTNKTFEVRLAVTSSKEVEWIKLIVVGVTEESFAPTKQVTTSITVPNDNTVYELVGKVRTKDGEEKETRIKIGVNIDPTASPTPSPTPSVSPLPSALI